MLTRTFVALSTLLVFQTAAQFKSALWTEATAAVHQLAPYVTTVNMLILIYIATILTNRIKEARAKEAQNSETPKVPKG